MLFSDPTGSGMENAPQVLVQGTADVDDADLDANRERYLRESAVKLPETTKMLPPKALQRLFDWYYTRIYVHVRPERIYVWADGDATNEPQLFDAHMEEVRSGHDEEPPTPSTRPTEGGAMVWDERMDELGSRYPQAVLSLVAPDGFPFTVRLPISVDRAARRIRLGAGVLGLPVQPGLACLTAHDHHPSFLWQRNFQVRGDLVEEDGGWALDPAQAGRRLRAAAQLDDREVPAQRRQDDALPQEGEAGASRAGAELAPRKQERDANFALEVRSPVAEASGSAGRALQPLGFALCAPSASLRCI